MPFRRQPPLDDQFAFQQAYQTQEALFRFLNELSPGQLSLREHNPEFILGKISEGLEAVSGALLADSTLTPAWMLKGRYHLSCMEVAQAKEAFAAAAKCAESRRAQQKPDLLGADNPADMIALCDQAMRSSGDRFKSAARLLSYADTPADLVAAGAIEFFEDKTIAKKSAFGPSPTGRLPGRSEMAVDLIAANGGGGQVKMSAGGQELSISGIANLSDLSPVKKFTPLPTRLLIEGALALDWTSLAALPLEGLDLTGCQLSAIPPATPLFQRLQNLVLKDTAFSELSFARKMPQLISLDISGTQVADLSPLAACHWLQSLDAGKLSLTNLQSLRFLPLARLTVSPTRITDKASLNGLRTWRQLRVLRAPGDPADQPAAEFWKKLDSGGYVAGQ